MCSNNCFLPSFPASDWFIILLLNKKGELTTHDLPWLLRRQNMYTEDVSPSLKGEHTRLGVVDAKICLTLVASDDLWQCVWRGGGAVRLRRWKDLKPCIKVVAWCQEKDPSNE